MTELTLTDQERVAFCRDVTHDLALDYFFVFDNVPQHFIYRDRIVPGELTEIERRNKEITETLWVEAYHTFLMGNVSYRFLYRGSVLQMALQAHQTGAAAFQPPAPESRPLVATAGQVRANFDAWMRSTGWDLVAAAKGSTPRGSWQTVVNVPDRTMRIASLIPVGNQVLAELIVTWSEEGVLNETAFVAVLLYDSDGSVLQDRSYIELAHWPSTRRWQRSRVDAPPNLPDRIGVMEQFYEYHRAHRLPVQLNRMEERNLSVVEGLWVDAYNRGHRGPGVFHPERFRLQLPLQKWSCNLDVANEIEAGVLNDTPDRTMRPGLTYAKGNQVVVEGVVSWTQNGSQSESPFISFLLLDEDGLIIRERRYLSLDNWPGAGRMRERLGPEV
jgi:hypothetical protein